MTYVQMINRLFLACFLIFSLGCASTDKQASTGERLDDTVITTRVKAAIFGDDMLKVTEINVETFKGTVQLSGFVTSREHANRAVEVARGVPGVKDVKNNMQIK